MSDEWRIVFEESNILSNSPMGGTLHHLSVHGITLAIRTVKDLGDAAAMAGVLASTLIRKVEPQPAPSKSEH